HLLHLGVDQCDHPFMIHRYRGVRRCFQQVAELGLRPLPPEYTSQMIAQLVDDVQELGIRIANFCREELENSEQLRAVSNGKAKRCFESMLCGELSTEEIVILGYVHDPSGGILLPDPARKPGTPLELHLEAHLPERWTRQCVMK